MDNTLEELADTVKKHEYEELFPETPVEKAKEEEGKVKEALFQVHHMVYSPTLFDKVHGDNAPENSDYHISMEEIAKATTDKEYNRVVKQLQGATVVEEDGKTMVPKVDIHDVLSARPGLRD